MPVKPRHEQHTDDTRAALLDAATRRFGTEGYAGTRLEQVVADARVTTGAVYHHFGSKRGLFAAVLERLHDQVVARLLALAEQDGLAGDDLWDLIVAGFLAYVDAGLDPVYVRVNVVDAPAVLGSDEIAEIKKRGGAHLLREWLGEATREGLIAPLPLDALTDLLGMLVGDASRYVAQANDREQARSEVGQVVRRLLDGLRRRPDECR